MKIWIILLIAGACIFGVLLGFLTVAFYSAGQYNLYSVSIYACYDGCSIATKDSEGYLTNKTWDCWDKCNSYVQEVLCDMEKKQ